MTEAAQYPGEKNVETNGVKAQSEKAKKLSIFSIKKVTS